MATIGPRTSQAVRIAIIASLALFAIILAEQVPADDGPAKNVLQTNKDATANALGSTLAERLGRRDESQSRPKLRLIYFHASDREPLADYVERWQRILDDVQSFYQSEMDRNGFGPAKFDYVKTDEGWPDFRVVQGRHPSARYSYDTGREILAEIRDELAGEIDIDASYTLVVHGLCDDVAEREFRFHAPYYGEGWSDWRAGMCHVADCPLLDPDLLTETASRVKYWEHYGQFDQTTAAFNTKYLGGVAHELGHGFGLPHNAERPRQRRTLGPALMGDGNHTYRRDVWSNKPGSFLTLASAVRLATHPLFGGYTEEHDAAVSVKLTDGTFDESDGVVRFRGSITSAIEPIAAILYADPRGRDNYDAQISVAEVVDGRFACDVDFDNLKSGEIRFAVALVNGATLEPWRSTMDTQRGRVDVQSIVARVAIEGIQRLYFSGDVEGAREEAARVAEDFATSEHLDFIESVAAGGLNPPVRPLADVTADEVSLAEVEWDSADVGWMRPARNIYAGKPRKEQYEFLQLDGMFTARGLYAHAPSRYTYLLGGKWSRLRTTIGFQTGGASEAIWKVVGDGEVLIQSKPIEPGRHESWDVDVAGVDQLELVIESTLPTNGQCWTIWGNPRLTR